jgi:hypothetical protein
MHANESDPDVPDRWTQLAQILGGMPDVIERLIAEHVPDESSAQCAFRRGRWRRGRCA